MVESIVENTIKNRAKSAGWLVRKAKWIGRRGAPDDIFAKGGRVVMIEFKKPGKEATLQQKREHDRWRDAGVEVYVVNRITDGVRILGLEGLQ
jgi:hypothetical protein